MKDVKHKRGLVGGGGRGAWSGVGIDGLFCWGGGGGHGGGSMLICNKMS